MAPRVNITIVPFGQLTVQSGENPVRQDQPTERESEEVFYGIPVLTAPPICGADLPPATIYYVEPLTTA